MTVESILRILDGILLPHVSKDVRSLRVGFAFHGVLVLTAYSRLREAKPAGCRFAFPVAEMDLRSFWQSFTGCVSFIRHAFVEVLVQRNLLIAWWLANKNKVQWNLILLVVNFSLIQTVIYFCCEKDCYMPPYNSQVSLHFSLRVAPVPLSAAFKSVG